MTLTLVGQIRGGKNNVQITRTGHRYPNKSFEIWRNESVRQLSGQIARMKPMCTPTERKELFPMQYRVEAIIDYTPGDLKTRDVPAMMDALWSVLVKARVLADDGLIREVVWREHPLDRQAPRVRVELRKL